MVDIYFYFAGSSRFLYLAKNIEYDDAELRAVEFAKNNLSDFAVTAKNILFLRIDGTTNSYPADVTIIITSHKE